MVAVSRWITIPAWVMVVLSILYGGVCWYIMNQILTPRRMICTIMPAQLGFSETQDLKLKSVTDGLELRGWLVPSFGDSAIILVHGVHAQSWDGHSIDLVRAYAKAGFHVLLFDLRGHGKSSGKHVGLGIPERGDVRAAVNELSKRGFAPGKIGIHGTSYGAAVTLLAVPEIKEIGAVIADSSFADVRDVISGEIQRETGLPPFFGKILLPGVGFLGRQLHSVDVRESIPENAIGKISPRPILLIHGTEDSSIPFDQALRLKAAGGKEVELWPLVGHEHVEGIMLFPDTGMASPMRERFLRRVTEFFRTAL